MKQTVVGVFETSEEARRAQAALLDAQFAESSVRMSASSALRGVDEGMAYPVGGPRGFDASYETGASDSLDPTGASDPLDASAGERFSERERLARAHRRGHGHEHALDRVTEFFKGLFSPESQREELSRYEQALRRGGALVAVDVEDEIEQSLASDILIRAGAYDLEERSAQWEDSATSPQVASLDPVPGSVQTRPIRSAAMPGNVTSMDPGDATGYRASRTDFSTGETWPASRTAFSDHRSEFKRDTASTGDIEAGAHEMRDPVRHEDLTRAPVGSGTASWDRLQGDYGVEGDYGSASARDVSQSMQQRSERSMERDAGQRMQQETELGMQQRGGQRMQQETESGMQQRSWQNTQQGAVRTEYLQPHQTREASGSDDARRDWHDGPEGHAWLEVPEKDRGMTAGSYGEERVQSQPVSSREASSPTPSHMRTDISDDLDTPIIRSRDLDRPPPSPDRPAVRTHMAGSDMPTGDEARVGDEADTGNEVVSSDEARHLLASGCEVFLDDCGFARVRNRGRVQPIQRDEPTKISRHVRVYTRRADDPQAQRAARMSDDSFSHEASDRGWSASKAEGDRNIENEQMARSDKLPDMRSTERPVSRDSEAMAARDRRMMRASLRARDCDDERELDPFTSEPDAMTSRGSVEEASYRRDPASGDWAAEWAAENRATFDESYSPGPDDLEADRLGDDAAGRSAAAMTGQPMPASGRRPTGAEDLARREAALREQTLSDYGEGDREQRMRHPDWRDSASGDPRERAAELARREATLRDQTLQDYAAMDERAEMRAANAAAAARASSHASMTDDAARTQSGATAASATTSPADTTKPTKDMSAELGLHSPLADRYGARRTALDDGAPLRETYDDDDRRYSAQDDTYPTDEAFVDTRDPRHQRRTRAPADWDHMKAAVRNAWHKMTHPGRHH